MGRRFKQVTIALVVVITAAQLVRPDRANPAIDPTRTIQAQSGTSDALATVLDRGCGDCHSNATVWPWYTEIAPVSWVMALAVTEGRKAVNFSEWASYPAPQRDALLAASCADASSGKMPGSAYTLLRPEAELSAADIETICSAARQVTANAPGGR